MKLIICVLSITLTGIILLSAVSCNRGEEQGQKTWKGMLKDGTEIDEHGLSKILEEHKKWHETGGKEGLRAKLSGASLSNADMRGADMSGADLSDASLSNANLSNANLSNANLYKADLKSANLSGADLREANLKNAYLDFANLREANLNKANMSGADLVVNNVGKILYLNPGVNGANMSGADLCRANLSEADLTETDLTNAELSGADLSKADLSKANLSEANLNNADLSGADLTETNLVRANLSGADLTETNLNEAKVATLRIYLNPIHLSKANLSGVDLNKADLRKADLSEANLSGTNLNRANLSGANLSKANMIQADLSEANLCEANLNKADLSKASMIQVDLSEANLSEANLNKADLSEANLKGANIKSADLREANLDWAFLLDVKRNKQTQIAHKWGLVMSLLYDIDFGVGQDLRNFDLSNANLMGANLSRANLSGTNLSGANLSGTNLSKANLSNVKVIGSDFRYCSFDPINVEELSILGAKGFSTINFENIDNIVKLRKVTKEAGFKGQERQLTAALRKKRFNATNLSGRIFENFFLDYPTDYGAKPWRCLEIFGVLFAIFSIPYMVSLSRESEEGIWMEWVTKRMKKKMNEEEPFRLETYGYEAFLYGLYFSLLSAFHIGWRDLNVGSWIARMQPSEYSLKATGWVRVVSGVQSLISIYLLALWALTQFGRPFE